MTLQEALELRTTEAFYEFARAPLDPQLGDDMVRLINQGGLVATLLGAWFTARGHTQQGSQFLAVAESTRFMGDGLLDLGAKLASTVQDLPSDGLTH